MSQNDLRHLRARRKRKSYTSFFALFGFVLVIAVSCGVYSHWSAVDETSAASVSAKSDAAEPQAEDSTSELAPTPTAKAAMESLKEEPASPPAANAPKGTSILVKKSEFRLEDGTAVNSWPVALGKNAGQKRVSGDMKTPDGSFPVDEILDASYWTHDFGDGKGEIAGAYGPYFISLDTSALSGGAWDGIGIHGTHDPASIGTCASEGCIRMNNSDLRTLKKHISVGTRVTIEE